MNTAIRCIILLACIYICNSKSILRCRCARINKTVKAALIHDVQVYKPEPYCSKKEVIVTLKDGRLVCLDPTQEFTKKVLAIQKMSRANKKENSSNKTTAASDKAAQTSSK